MKEASRLLPIPPSRMICLWTRNTTRARRARSAGSCSLRPRLWSWRGASVSNATCPARKGSSWPDSSAWPRRKWRSGSRTTATKWREAELKGCRTWSYRSPLFCAGSWFPSWSGMGNLFIPAYLTRRKQAVCRLLLRRHSPCHTLPFSIHPPLLFLQDTSSTFTLRRPPGSPGETFGATPSTLIPSSEGPMTTNKFI